MRASKLGRVVFIRHGESIWNVTDPSRGLVTRFTGWADVPLTDRGRNQAVAAGRCLEKFNIVPDAVFTSLLSRSKDSYKEILKVNPTWQSVPVISSWRLNERHYGGLVGLSKEEAGRKLGAEKVMDWRRSWDQAPPLMQQEDVVDLSHTDWGKPMTIISHPGKKQIVTVEKGISVPRTESLADCANRVWPLWVNGIAPRVARGETVLIVAHANSIRSMVKHIDSDTMSVASVRDVKIPSATPLVYSFEGRESLSGGAMSIKPMGEPTALGMTGRYIATKEMVRLAIEDPKEVSSFQLEDSHGSDDVATSIYDLMDRGLTEIIEYSDSGLGKRDALIITDGRGYIVHSNLAWEKLCGFSINEIKGKTNRFLQGPLTDEEEIADLNQEVQSGLVKKTSVINYRKNGRAFENNITILPVYSWLRDDNIEAADSDNDTIITTTTSSSSSNNSSSRNHNGTKIDHSLGFDGQNRSQARPEPNLFIAKLEVTPDLMNLPPLTPEQMAQRGLRSNSDSSK